MELFIQAPWIWLEVEQSHGILQVIKWCCVSSFPRTRSFWHAPQIQPGLQNPILFTQEHTHQCLAFSDATGGQASSKSGHRGTSKIWQEKGGEFTMWGFLTVLCGTRTQTEIFRLWMGHAFSSCPGSTCRHNRLYRGKPGVARVKSPRQWCLTPQESQPPGNLKKEKYFSSWIFLYVYYTISYGFKILIETLIPNIMMFGNGVRWEEIRTWGWSPHEGISALRRRDTRQLASSLFTLCHVRTQWEDGHL